MHITTSDQATLPLGFGDYTCNWGVHIAGLFETPAERDDILFGYLHQGVVDGDLQLYCSHPHRLDEFEMAYRARHPDRADDIQNAHCFQLRSARDLYYPDGTFSPWAMEDGLNAFYADVERHGPRNIRATAEMSWALDTIPGVEHLMAYESRLNYFIPDKPWISICLYDLNLFSGTMIMDVLRTHPYTISGGVITENPYYQDPDDWLSRHAPEFAPHS